MDFKHVCKGIFMALSSLVLAGCTSYSITPYAVSADNISVMRKHQGNGFNVGLFESSSPETINILCMGDTYIYPPNRVGFNDFIKSSFISEAKIADVYDAESPVTLSGNLNSIDYKLDGQSNSVIWSISLTINSTNGSSLTINNNSPFKIGSILMKSTCVDTAQALIPAIQNTLYEVVNDVSFPKLIN